MADCERALGRPERALALASNPSVAKLSPGAADRDDDRRGGCASRPRRGDGALRTLERAPLRSVTREDWLVRLRYAYADTCCAGRTPRGGAGVVPPHRGHRRRRDHRRRRAHRGARDGPARAPTTDASAADGGPGRAVPARSNVAGRPSTESPAVAVAVVVVLGRGCRTRRWSVDDPRDEAGDEGRAARCRPRTRCCCGVGCRRRRSERELPSGTLIVMFRVIVPRSPRR